MFGLGKSVRIYDDTGIILGYGLSLEDESIAPEAKRILRQVLKRAKKGRKAWKTPTFISDLVKNPAPLMLKEHWYIDEQAVPKAIDMLERNHSLLTQRRIQGIEKIRYIFKESDRFEYFPFQTLLNRQLDPRLILDGMRECEHSYQRFRKCIKPLEKTLGRFYAYPTNYMFEKFNAGIIRALSDSYPGLSILDNVLRAPVYEFLGILSFEKLKQSREILDIMIRVTRDYQPPIPKSDPDGSGWDADSFIKLHKSKGASQLREIVGNLGSSRETVSENQIGHFVSSWIELSKELPSSMNVINAFAGYGSSLLTALGAISIPISLSMPTYYIPVFYIPAAAFTQISFHSFLGKLRDFAKGRELRWLDVANQLAEFCAVNTI